MSTNLTGTIRIALLRRVPKPRRGTSTIWRPGLALSIHTYTGTSLRVNSVTAKPMATVV
jgi:hypothetical protein